MPEVNMNSQTDEKTRFVQSPVMDATQSSSSVFNVELKENEDVQWIWTHHPNGQSVVMGYKILNKDSGKTESTIHN
jgi:hypothetical protein